MKNDTNEKSQVEITYGVNFGDPTPLVRIDVFNICSRGVYVIDERSTMVPYPGYRLTKGEVRELIHMLQSSINCEKENNDAINKGA